MALSAVPGQAGTAPTLPVLTVAAGVPLASPADATEGRLRQANLSGLVMGMGLTVTVVFLIIASTQPSRASWALFGFACLSVLTVVGANGYAAIWFLPASPEFSDAARLVGGMVLAGWMLWTTTELLDGLDRWPLLRLLGPLAPAFALVAGLLLRTALPASWRACAGLLFSALCIALAATLCALSWLAAGSTMLVVALAVAMYAVVVALGAAGTVMVVGVDVTSAVAASLLFGCSLLMRHAQFTHMRYGRDVLGRSVISAHRDPLTALWSYEGFQQRHDEVTLRLAAAQVQPAMMLLQMPGLEHSAAEHGFELTERALVRFAALLQSMLGRGWVIGRLSKSRFAVVSLRPMDGKELVELATQLLSRCTRLERPLCPVTDFDLRVVCRPGVPAGHSLAELVQEMDEAGLELEPGRRIALL